MEYIDAQFALPWIHGLLILEENRQPNYAGASRPLVQKRLKVMSTTGTTVA